MSIKLVVSFQPMDPASETVTDIDIHKNVQECT